MSLSRQQKRELQEALINAFATRTSLEQMLDHELDKNLEAIAGNGNLETTIFNLIKLADAQGWVEDLIHAARNSNDGNERLQAIAEKLLSRLPVTLPNPPTEPIQRNRAIAIICVLCVIGLGIVLPPLFKDKNTPNPNPDSSGRRYFIDNAYNATDQWCKDEYQQHARQGELPKNLEDSVMWEQESARCFYEINKFEVQYQAHVAGFGWQNSVFNGDIAGTNGLSLRMEAIKIWLVNPPSRAPSGAKICYETHVAKIGWQNKVCDGAVAGTTGESRQMEAIRIWLDPPSSAEICYETHVANIGWQKEVCDGAVAGTIKENRQMEAIRIKVKWFKSPKLR